MSGLTPLEKNYVVCVYICYSAGDKENLRKK